MDTEAAPLAQAHPGWPTGLPAIVAAGPVVNLRLFVPSKPVPQQRPRGRVSGVRKQSEGVWLGKPWIQMYEEKQCVEYQELVTLQVRNQVLRTPVQEHGGGGDFTLPFEGVRALLVLRFNFLKPPSYPKRVVDHIKKPDFDNLAKAVVDGIVKANVLKDDGLITDATIQKRYAEFPDHPEGVEIDLTVFPTEHT